jgi:dienelactone hydrolase
MKWLALVAVTAVASGAASGGGRLSVTPRVAPLDVPFRVHATDLAPGKMVVVRATASAGGRRWTADVRARADAHGVLDLQRFLLGAMRPVGRATGRGFPSFVQTVSIAVGNASAEAERFTTAASVAIRDERPSATGFYGEWFEPARASHRPAILLVGGSAGGLPDPYLAGLLATHGYPVLSLAYFGAPGLPSTLTRIPLEYFKHAVLWLRKRPQVDARRIVAVGISRGGEAALLLASTYPRLVRDAITIVGSGKIGPSPGDPSSPAWDLNGKPVAPGREVDLRTIAGSVFAAGGGADALTPSAAEAASIGRRRRATGRRYDTVLVYPRAGHGLGAVVPNVPTFPTADSRYGVLRLGGSTDADEAARERLWPRLLAFLRTA